MAHIVREFRPEDADGVAQLYNESDRSFPGGLTRGMRYTPEMLLEDETKRKYIAVYLVELEGKIIGYCSLDAVTGDEDVAWVGFLNVHPDYHGQGYGKALLLQSVDKITQLGYKRLDLGTWPANLKAVPLYKKTGFFWIPETNVYMQNYLPQILNIPLAKEFFQKHDWYKTFKRDLSQKEDEYEWHGVKVLPYIWEADDELLKVIIDRAANAPTAFETNDYAIAAILGKDEAAAGISHKIKWEIKNKCRKPLSVALIAEAEEGIRLSRQESLTVENEKVIESEFEIDINIKDKDLERPQEPAHKIKSTFIVNGKPLTLQSAFRVRQPVELYSGWGYTRLIPNKPEKVMIVARNFLEENVKGKLYISSHPALKFNRHSANFKLKAKESTGLEFQVTAAQKGAFRFPIHTTFKLADRELKTKPIPFTFHAAPLGRVTTSMDERSIWLENDNLRITIWLYGRGQMRIFDKLEDMEIASQPRGDLGPPFVPWWGGATRKIDAELKEINGAAQVKLSGPSETYPGLIMHKIIKFTASPFIEIAYRLVNDSNAPIKAQLQLNTWFNLPHSKYIVPLKEGITTAAGTPYADFAMREDWPKKANEYQADWIASAYKDYVVGLIWQGCLERDFNTLTFDIPEIPSQGYADLKPLYLYAGKGNWQTVHHHWQRLTQQPPFEPVRIREKPILQINWEPSPLVINQSQTQVKIVVKSLRKKELNGKLNLVMPRNWQADEKKLALANINREKPFEETVELVAPTNAEPSVYQTQFKLSTDLFDEQINAPIVLIGDKNGSVKYRENEKQGTIELHNGCYQLKVAPHFHGSLYAIEQNGVNHLLTSYPEAKELAWMKPWFGGVHPYIGWAVGPLMKEKFTYQLVERTGEQGIYWSGVKVISEPEHKDYKWLKIEVEYLTNPMSNVVAVIARRINKTKAPQRVGSGLAFFLQPGGSYSERVAYFETERLRQHKSGPYGGGGDSEAWAAIENTITHDTACIIIPDPQCNLSIEDWAESGTHVFANFPWRIETKETNEFLCYLVLTDSMEKAKAYKILEHLACLP